MGTLVQDLRFGLRMMLKSPVVTSVAVLSLALGIAANASMFALLNSFLWEPLPYEDQDELVLFQEVERATGIEGSPGVSVANFRDYAAAAAQGLEASTLYTVEQANVTGVDVPERLQVVVATPNVFEVFGATPMLGRAFRPEEGVEGAGSVLVLEYDYWQRRFLGDRDVLGRTLTLGGAAHTIIGVMPESFDMIPANVQAYRPSDFRDQADDRGQRGYIGFGRLAPGVDAARLDAQLAPVAERLDAEYPESNRGWTVSMLPLREWFPGPTDTQLLRILTFVTLFGLLIACANVANLLLSRAEERQKEVAVRTALGAGRTRVLRQLLTESVVMGALAGVLGAVMSVWVVRWLQTAMPAELPQALMPELDPEVLVATMVVSVAAGVAFGLAPSLHAVRGNLGESLGSGGRGGTAGRSRKRLRNIFVVGEVAIALALLSGSGFLIQAFDQLTNEAPGFTKDGLLTFQLSVLEDRYKEGAEVALYEEELIRALQLLPGVDGVAMMSSLPRSRGNPRTRYSVDERPVEDVNERPAAFFQVVNPDYFSTMEIPLLQGRTLDDTDRADAPPVVVVSQALAELEFADQDPVGRRITVFDQSREIVGVAGDILQDRLAIAGRSGEAIYLPMAQRIARNPSFALRAGGDPTELAADIRRAVWGVEPDQPVANLRSLQAHIDESLAGPGAILIFLLGMGVIALVLAAMGIYGVMAHTVAQQQREIGIRMALGAERGNVIGMVARSGLSLVLIGLVLGAPLVVLMFWGTASALNVFNVGLALGYPLYLAVALFAVAVIATLIPARRASGVAPVAALRE